MNRKERRKLGFTESRYRKTDVDFEGNNPKTSNVFHCYHREEAFKLGDTTLQRTQRLDNKPRTWKYEKARRRLAQIDLLTKGVSND